MVLPAGRGRGGQRLLQALDADGQPFTVSLVEYLRAYGEWGEAMQAAAQGAYRLARGLGEGAAPDALTLQAAYGKLVPRLAQHQREAVWHVCLLAHPSPCAWRYAACAAACMASPCACRYSSRETMMGWPSASSASRWPPTPSSHNLAHLSWAAV